MTDLASPNMTCISEAKTSASSFSGEAGGLAEAGLSRASTLERVGEALTHAGSKWQLQRARNLPKDDENLVHAATMPMIFDTGNRPWWGGLWKTQQIIGFCMGMISMILLCTVRPVAEYAKANDMLGLTALMACFWVFEVIPIYATALIPIVVMPLLEITSSSIVAQAYWNWISLLLVSTYMVSIALETAQLPRRIAVHTLLRVGVLSPAALLACIMALSWFLGMVVNNIFVAMLLTPVAVSMMTAAEEQVRNASEDLETAEAAAAMESSVKHLQKFSDALLLGIAYSASVGGMATLTGSMTHYFLCGGMNFSEVITWVRWLKFAGPISLVTIAVVYITLYLRYIRGLKFKGIKREALEAELNDLESNYGTMSRDEVIAGFVLVLQLVLFVIRPFAIAPFLTSPSGAELVNDATVAAAPALLLVFVPSQVRSGEAILTWPAVHARFDFGLLLLIGGAMAINSGFTESGLNLSIGQAVASIIPHVSSCTLDLTIIVFVTLCSQVISNVGTAATMLPILTSAAMQAVVNPLSLLLPAAIATSFSFVLPTAAPANIVALAKSADLPRALRIRDFVSNGIPLTTVACLVGAALTHVMANAVFDVSAPFPQPACEAASSGNCVFLDVPGVVQGRYVESQACIIDMGAESDGSLCRIWNGTVLTVPDVAPGV